MSFDDDNENDDLEEYWVPEVGRFEELPEGMAEHVVEEYGGSPEEFTEYAEFDPFAEDVSDEVEEEQEEAEEEAEELEEWHDIESQESPDYHGVIVSESDGELVSHFDYLDDALEYTKFGEISVLKIVIDDEGGADVYREKSE